MNCMLKTFKKLDVNNMFLNKQAYFFEILFLEEKKCLTFQFILQLLITLEMVTKNKMSLVFKWDLQYLAFRRFNSY